MGSRHVGLEAPRGRLAAHDRRETAAHPLVRPGRPMPVMASRTASMSTASTGLRICGHRTVYRPAVTRARGNRTSICCDCMQVSQRLIRGLAVPRSAAIAYPDPIVCAGQTFGWAHASRSSVQICARIARAESLDIRLRRSAACAFPDELRVETASVAYPHAVSRTATDPRFRWSEGLFAGWRVQCAGSGHRRHMSHDIGDTMSQDIGNTHATSMLGHVESPPGHHRPVRRAPDPRRGRRPLRRAPRLGLQAQGPLRGRGRDRPRAPLPAPQTSPGATPPETVELVLRLRKELLEAGHDAGPDTLRLAPDPAPPGHPVPSHRPPHPDPPRRDHPRTEEATQVLLHPVRGRDAERDLAVRLHPLPAHPTRRHPRHRRRDHHLARRLHPLRPARLRPPPGHHPDREGHLPQNRRPARHPRLHADRQRDGLHRPPGRHRTPRRPQRLRAATPHAGT